MLCNFRLVLKGKEGKEVPQSSRSELLKKLLPNNFALPDAKDHTSRSLNRGIVDLLLAIHQKSQEQSFREIMHSFVLLAYACLSASRTLLQQLLASLNFTLDSSNLFCW